MIVAGGSYLEICKYPAWRRLFGSGLRAAGAIGRMSPRSVLHTYVAGSWARDVERSANAFAVAAKVVAIDQEISFSYLYPLADAALFPEEPIRQQSLHVRGEVVLRYGFVEGDAVVEARRAVHDPQGGRGVEAFRSNGSRAEALALVLNEGEAEAATGIAGEAAGTALLAQHGCDAVVLKQGPRGARVFRAGREPAQIPAYLSERVFKIGSGDVFSAAFAHYWGERELDPAMAADLASRQVAAFVGHHDLPLRSEAERDATLAQPGQRAAGPIYLAAPFFDIAQRWLVEEIRDRLALLGAQVFSPLHEVGIGLAPQDTAEADLAGLNGCAAVLAVVDGRDPGTLFEVGYARSRGKPVVVLAERTTEEDLTMLAGSGCRIATDLTSALYHAVWAATA